MEKFFYPLAGIQLVLIGMITTAYLVYPYNVKRYFLILGSTVILTSIQYIVIFNHINNSIAKINITLEQKVK